MAREPDVALLMAAFVKKICKNMIKNMALSAKIVALSAKKVPDPCSEGTKKERPVKDLLSHRQNSRIERQRRYIHGLVEVKNYQQIFLIRRINKQDSIRILKLCRRFYHEKYRTNAYYVLVGGGEKLSKQKATVRIIG